MNDFLSAEEIRQIIIILLEKLIKNEYISDKDILLSILCDFSACDRLEDSLMKFIETYQIEIFDLIFHHLIENKTIDKRINLKIFDNNKIINHIQNLVKNDNVIQIINFLDNFCYNIPKNILSQQFLQKIIQDKINEKLWNGVLLINNYMKNNGLENDLQNISIPNEDSDIDDIISYFLSDPHPEKNDTEKFTILFNKMIKDKEIYQSYIIYLLFFNKFEYSVESILKSFLNEYERNPNEFMKIVNHIAYFDEKTKIIKLKSNYKLISLNNLEFGLSVISKLFASIKEKQDNYQAFLCLKNIANSFPFLFVKEPQNLFNTVIPYLDYFHLIFEKNLNEKSINLVKTTYSASYFIYMTFQSPFILDNFFDWLFCNITKFTNSQVFCFFMILLNLNNIWKYFNVLVFEKCLKHNFFKTCKNLLERNIQNKIFRFYYKNYICRFISMIIISVINFLNCEKIKNNCIELDEYSKIEHGIYILSNNVQNYPKNMHFSSIHEIELDKLNNTIVNFIFKLEKSDKIGLSSWFNNKKEKSITEMQINDFKSKLIKCEDLVYSNIFPNFPYPLSIKMYRYLVTKTYKIFLYLKDPYLNWDNFFNATQEEYKQHINAFNELNKLQIQAKNDKDDKENDDVSSFDVNLFLFSWFKDIINLVICPSLDYKNFMVLLKIFLKLPRNFLVFILDSFSHYINILLIQNVGSESYLALKSMYRLADIFNTLLKFKEINEDIFYPCIDKLLRIVLLPKWRNDSELLIKVSSFLTNFISLPIRANHLIAYQIYKLSPDKSNYFTVNHYISLVQKIYKSEFNKKHIELYIKYAADYGFLDAKLLYFYMMMDDKNFKINKKDAIQYFKNAINFNVNNTSHQNALKIIDINFEEAIKYIKNYKYECNNEELKLHQSNDAKYIFISAYKTKNSILQNILYKRAADLGDTLSMYQYSISKSFPIDNNDYDKKKYIKYYNLDKLHNEYLNEIKCHYLRKAAENQNEYALIDYIILLLMKKDKYKPSYLAKWFIKGINYDWYALKYEYGLLLATGESSVSIDKEKGEKYITELANNGYFQAMSYFHKKYMKNQGIFNNNSFEYFEDDAKQYEQILLNYKNDNSKIFVDKNFHHFENWKRIDEIYDAPLFQSDLIDPGFVNQGDYGDCFFIAAMTRIAKQHYLVPLLFETKLPNKILGHVKNSINIKCGAVVIYFQAFGRKIPVLIDTLIPVNKDNKPLLSKPSEDTKSPWFCLVEKAFIKLHGTFENTSQGFFTYSIYSLFFYNPLPFVKYLSFSDIMEYQEKGYLISSNIKNKENCINQLISNHAYLIHKARISNGINFIFMQNPWGKTEWTGDYSRNSNLWTPGLKKALNYDYLPSGSFWIKYDDFIKCFDTFEIIKPIDQEWHIKMFQYKLLPGYYDGINFMEKEARLEEHKTFIIHFKDEIQKDNLKFYIIIEKRSTKFQYECKKSYFCMVTSEINGERISHDTISNTSNNNSRFFGVNEVESFECTANKNKDISILFHRCDKRDFIENCYVSVICKYQFDIYDFDDREIIYNEVENPGIVFENYTISDPSISKKIKIKIFNKKFVLSLDSETQITSSNFLSQDARDKRLE